MERQQTMYLWRKLKPVDQEALLRFRQTEQRPWHSPPHYQSDDGLYLITAACYEHHHIAGHSLDRLSHFARDLLQTIEQAKVHAWILLPNHYHLLLEHPDVKDLLKQLGRLHGRTSRQWNLEEAFVGRKVWCNAVETAIKSEGHFYAALNYVLHNAVKHRYVERWQDWPFSNAAKYLTEVGHDEAERRWKTYPILDMGKVWDPPEL